MSTAMTVTDPQKAMSAQAGPAWNKMQRARVKLVLDQPFFGMLVLSQLRFVLREDLPAPMATDGKCVYFRSAEVVKWSMNEVCAVICHEVLHAANGHVWRRDEREKMKWNMACDYAINTVIEECGMTLPQEALLNAAYSGKSAEAIYRLLPNTSSKKSGGWEDLLEGATGEDGKPLTEAQKEAEVRGWQQAVQQAVMASKMQGKVPAGLERMCGEVLKPKCDWKALLARFVQNSTKSDYSWKRLNRRYLAAGLWLPSLWSESTRPIVVAIDTSGSVGEEELKVFVAELNGIVNEAKPERVYVVWADAAVAGVQVFEQGEELVLEAKGGGGTDFRPVFEWVRTCEEDVACVVYLTDMYGTFPEVAPEVPVMWVAVSEVVGPFGETIRLEA